MLSRMGLCLSCSPVSFSTLKVLSCLQSPGWSWLRNYFCCLFCSVGVRMTVLISKQSTTELQPQHQEVKNVEMATCVVLFCFVPIWQVPTKNLSPHTVLSTDALVNFLHKYAWGFGLYAQEINRPVKKSKSMKEASIMQLQFNIWKSISETHISRCNGISFIICGKSGPGSATAVHKNPVQLKLLENFFSLTKERHSQSCRPRCMQCQEILTSQDREEARFPPPILGPKYTRSSMKINGGHGHNWDLIEP